MCNKQEQVNPWDATQPKEYQDDPTLEIWKGVH